MKKETQDKIEKSIRKNFKSYIDDQDFEDRQEAKETLIEDSLGDNKIYLDTDHADDYYKFAKEKLDEISIELDY